MHPGRWILLAGLLGLGPAASTFLDAAVGDSTAPTDLHHWAFEPVQDPAVPHTTDTRWPRNPIDRFILARLETEGLPPSPPASRAEWLRRVSLDLTGLPPTPEELAKMKAYVAQAMKDGAVGLSTGLIYLPGTFSKPDEVVELAKVIAPFDGIYASHMRHEDTRIYEALDEVFRVAREAKVRAEVSHIKLAGEKAWGQADKVLAYLDAARAEGLDITEDQYAYTASSTTMRQLIPDDAFDGGKTNFASILENPEEKAGLVMRMKQKLEARGRKDYAYAVIASYRHDPSLNGLNIVEATKKVRGNDSLGDQIEMILEIEKNGSASGVFHGMNEEDLQKFMQHPNTMIACDSGLREFGKSVPHPRGYGNNARVLGRYVRELNVLRLEDAVRKMTSLPANTFRLKDRGLLKEGFWADITLFDPAKVSDPAAFNDPHHYATGIPYVLVNGVPVIANNEHTGAKPGMGLRH